MNEANFSSISFSSFVFLFFWFWWLTFVLDIHHRQSTIITQGEKTMKEWNEWHFQLPQLNLFQFSSIFFRLIHISILQSWQLLCTEEKNSCFFFFVFDEYRFWKTKWNIAWSFQVKENLKKREIDIKSYLRVLFTNNEIFVLFFPLKTMISR